MSKKNSNSPSTRSSLMTVAGFMAFLAMVLAVVMLLVVAIIGQGQVANILNFIKDFALLVALAVPAYYFTKGKPKWVKIVFIIVLVCFLVAAVFGNHLIRLN